MTTRRAECSCGQLALTAEGEPTRISMCHCLACQRRTGSVFGVQARFPRDRVEISGRSNEWKRVADSGNRLVYHFCPECGATVYYEAEVEPDLVAVPVGALADPSFPPPKIVVYESRKHPWTAAPPGAERHI